MSLFDPSLVEAALTGPSGEVLRTIAAQPRRASERLRDFPLVPVAQAEVCPTCGGRR